LCGNGSHGLVLLFANCRNGGVFFAGRGLSPPELVQASGTLFNFSQAGVLLKNMVMIRESPTRAIPPAGGGDSVSSFFDIYVEISTDGGGSWSNGVDNDCDSFFDIFTEITLGGAGGAGGAQGLGMLNATFSGMPQIPGGIQVRESPTRSSGGQFQVTEAPGGYMIDSFFDVVLEVSVGGGQWVPADGPVRMIGTPEPASLLLLAMGAVALLRRPSR
jgi:hypothetical protein